MWNTGAYVGYEITRGILGAVTHGLTSKVNGGLKDASHECVEIHFDCNKCGKSSLNTLDLNNEGKHFNKSYYKKEISCRRNFNCTGNSLTFSKVWSVFDSLSSKYNLVNRNCSHFAGEMYWDCIMRI